MTHMQGAQPAGPPLSTWSPVRLALLSFELPLSFLIPYLYLHPWSEGDSSPGIEEQTR